ncbi:hypothetical protein KY325_00380 [Candidatus Woesearchaeota archaeon]|nr:hypothetical protein [Candidatus Woesearchaeota archaeon]
MAGEDKNNVIMIREDPDRRRRFFKYVLRHWKRRNTERSEKFREKFLKKIDKLRAVEDMRELKKVEKIKPVEARPIELIEKKIGRILDYEYDLEQEEKFNKAILSRLSENDERKIQLLKKILKKERLDTAKLDQLDEKFKIIEALRKSVQNMRQTLEKLHKEETGEERTVKQIEKKLDDVYTEVKEMRKKKTAVKKPRKPKTIKKAVKPAKKTATKAKKIKAVKKKTKKPKEPVRKYRLV